MKILVCGDSWSSAWGVDPEKAWHSYLGCEITNVAHPGLCNEQITKRFLSNYNDTYDLVIIGWSGATRIPRHPKDNTNPHTDLYEFSLVDAGTKKFFKNLSLTDILSYWQKNIDTVCRTASVPVYHFSVFGDQPLVKPENFIEKSFLEFVSEKQNMPFKYKIPIFEFDWLNAENYQLVGKFGKKYFDKNWKKACVERELVRPGTYFLPCGHPNADGHALWGQYMKELINGKL